MKKISIILFFFAVGFFACSKVEDITDYQRMNISHPDTLYYYDMEKKYRLSKVDDKFYVAFFVKNEKQLQREFAKIGITLKADDYVRNFSYWAYWLSLKIKKFPSYKIEIIEGCYQEATTALAYSFYWAPSYRFEDDHPTYKRGFVVGISEHFPVIIKPETTFAQVKKIAQEYSVEVIGQDESFPACYYLLCTNLSKGNSLEMAALLHESGLFEYSFPGFFSPLKLLNY